MNPKNTGLFKHHLKKNLFSGSRVKNRALFSEPL